MAKKEKNIYKVDVSENGLVEIEMIVDIAGMEKGTIKKLPNQLANQMIELNYAKLKN